MDKMALVRIPCEASLCSVSIMNDLSTPQLYGLLRLRFMLSSYLVQDSRT